MNTWEQGAPIHAQIAQRLVDQVIQGSLNPGDPAPSVRAAAAQLQVNPLTISRAYAKLTNQGVLETRRGRGTFVSMGARERLLATQRAHFLHVQWPAVLERIRLLGLDLAALPAKPGSTPWQTPPPQGCLRPWPPAS